MTTRTVGLVADPGLSTTIAESLADRLPAELAGQLDGRVNWHVEALSRSFPMDEHGNVQVWAHSDELKKQYGWDVLVYLTELTQRRGPALVVSDANTSRAAALVSLPALGPIRVRRHAAGAIVRVLADMTGGEGRAAGRQPPSAMPLRPIREEVVDDADGRNSFVKLTPARGRVRVLLGMVRVNRPWRLLPSLSSAIAAAVATAAFGVFYSSIWQMADAMSPVRLAVVSALAILAMMLWLMLYNGLWERPRDLNQRENAALYNSATVLTLAVGVASMYIVLFVVVMSGAVIIIPSGYLESTLGHPAGWRDYVQLALLASSLGTFAGALGSSFESDQAVRNATYGKREQERHARANR